MLYLYIFVVGPTGAEICTFMLTEGWLAMLLLPGCCLMFIGAQLEGYQRLKETNGRWGGAQREEQNALYSLGPQPSCSLRLELIWLKLGN